MKNLELTQMEHLSGGEIDCGDGIGATLGLTGALIAATIVTGGAAIFAVGAIAAFGIGSNLSVSNCRDRNWN